MQPFAMVGNWRKPKLSAFAISPHRLSFAQDCNAAGTAKRSLVAPLPYKGWQGRPNASATAGCATLLLYMLSPFLRWASRANASLQP
jgi:hypothetical protein